MLKVGSVDFVFSLSVKETTLRWVEQAGGEWWRSLWWKVVLLGGTRLGRFLLKVLENLLNDLGVLDTGNDFDLTAAVFADFDVDVKDSFEALHPSHCAMALCGTLITPVGIVAFRFVGLLAPLGSKPISCQ